jgi:spore coat polysaccharide biosynthesis predicted glycosyltransferase SpsG
LNTVLACSLSSEVGLGHFSRMRALNMSFRDKEAGQVYFSIFGNVDPGVNLHNLDVSLISDVSYEYFRLLTILVKEKKIDAVVLDFHTSAVDENLIRFLETARIKKIKLISVDSLLKYRNYLDHIWLPSVYFDLSKIEFDNNLCNVSFGWDHFLLHSKKKSINWKPGKEILVLTGGSDVLDLASWLPMALDDKLPEESVINWVRGPYSQPPQLPMDTKLNWRIHNSPEFMDTLICSSNYVLTLFGVSFFEVAQHGVPSVVVPLYPNENKAELDIIRNDKVAIVSMTPSDSIDALKSLMDDHYLADEISCNAKERMLMNGCDLLIDKISELIRN